ncbi:MAG: C-terminal binding protein [Chloroflexi bacterium]|nr:C-terminal binding protein [Chloroflexota bacterium]MDA1004409.1 C-terminal binding protein [Chloroflexota bacterium]
MTGNAQARFMVAVQKPRQVQQGGGSQFNIAGGAYRFEREALDPIGAEIVEIDAETDAEFIAGAKQADAVIARGRRITAEIIAGLERVVVIGCGSVGTDTVDVDAATDAGIPVTNVPDVFIEEVADHTMAILLAAHRRLYEMRQLIQDGRWVEGHPYLRQFPRLWGQTIGLISYGNVARAVARRCQPFGLHVIAHDPYVSENELTRDGVEPVGYRELFERSDFVSNHLPLNAETRHLIGREQFAAMKSSAIFVNAGRGPCHDEEALIEALQRGEIAGAGLDVFETEPVDLENPLLRMDNVIVTPHVASATSRMMPETQRRLGHEIASALQGRWPRSVVNPSVLTRSELRRWQPISMERGPNR